MSASSSNLKLFIPPTKTSNRCAHERADAELKTIKRLSFQFNVVGRNLHSQICVCVSVYIFSVCALKLSSASRWRVPSCCGISTDGAGTEAKKETLWGGETCETGLWEVIWICSAIHSRDCLILSIGMTFPVMSVRRERTFQCEPCPMDVFWTSETMLRTFTVVNRRRVQNVDFGGWVILVGVEVCKWDGSGRALTLPEERLVSGSAGGGSSSSLENESAAAAAGRVLWPASFVRYSCTYTSFVGLPLGSSTLLASSSLFSFSLVSTEGSPRYSGMSARRRPGNGSASNS